MVDEISVLILYFKLIGGRFGKVGGPQRMESRIEFWGGIACRNRRGE